MRAIVYLPESLSLVGSLSDSWSALRTSSPGSHMSTVGRAGSSTTRVSITFGGSGPSPGLVSARVELVDEEIVRIGIAMENDSGRPLENVTVHVCFNHRRSPMLGRRLFVQTASGWTDFRQYHQYFVTDSDSIRYDLRGEGNPGALPKVTQPLLFSETVHEKDDFVSVIGSRDASAIASNITWPCTDATLDFGDLLPRARTERDLYIGLGPGSRDAWLDRMARLL